MGPTRCPHCGIALRQARADGRCGGCGTALPDELRASPEDVAAARRAMARGNPTGPAPEDLIRRCRHLLYAVAELHGSGYGRVRVAPWLGDSAGGGRWWCAVVPAELTAPGHGARLAEGVSVFDSADRPYPVYPYGAPLDLVDPSALPAETARRILERYPRLAERGRGPDEAYVTWYAEMLRLTQPFGLVIASHYSDDVARPPPPTDVLRVVGGPTEWLEVPLPPVFGR